MAKTGVPGIAVGLTGIGALLVYAGLRGLNPIDALREVAQNEVKPVTNVGMREALNTDAGGTAQLGLGSGGSIVTASYGGSGPNAAIADAAYAFKNDKYTQDSRRTKPGYSDCSSFTVKAMRRAGIDTPEMNTYGFLKWKKLKKISKSEIARGDLLINGMHMAIALNGTSAIGQQNERRNVATGSHDDIMMKTGPWSAYRYVG